MNLHSINLSVKFKVKTQTQNFIYVKNSCGYAYENEMHESLMSTFNGCNKR